jgi:DNA-binding PucR family transcriptional regulator
MSSSAFDQLRDQLLRLPPDVIQTLRAALELEPKEQQELLDESPGQRPVVRREVKAPRVKPRDYSKEPKWLRENAHLYPGQRLAVSGDEFLAHRPDFGDVFDRAEATGKRFLMDYVARKDAHADATAF